MNPASKIKRPQHKGAPTLFFLLLPPSLLGFLTWGDQVLVSKVFMFTVPLLRWESLRKAPGWTSHLLASALPDTSLPGYFHP